MKIVQFHYWYGNTVVVVVFRYLRLRQISNTILEIDLQNYLWQKITS